MIISITTNAQSKSSLVNTWQVCTSTDIDLKDSCFNSSNAPFEFHKNGTYSDNRAYMIDGEKYKYHGKWKYRKGILSLDAADENGMNIPPFTYEINWIDETLFYFEGTEGRGGPVGRGPEGLVGIRERGEVPIVYTFFKKE